MKRKKIEVLDSTSFVDQPLDLGFDAGGSDFVLTDKIGKRIARHWSARQLSDWALGQGAMRVSWSGKAFEVEDGRN